MSNTLRWMISPLVGLSLLCGSLSAGCQNEQRDAKSADAKNSAAESSTTHEGATIKGKIVAEDGAKIEFDLATLPITIIEQIAYNPLPLPPDWGTRTADEREHWIKQFQESDAGKEFFAERETRLKNQRRIQLKLEKDGSFEIYDVPEGNYNLYGRKDVVVEGKKYAVEVYGQIELGNVEEQILQPLPIAVTRLLSVGEAAPDFAVESLTDAATKITLTQYQGRPILVYFWTMSNAGVEQEIAALKKAVDIIGSELNLELVAICVDKSVDKAAEFIASQQLNWPQGRTNGWTHAAFADYGLRAIPAFFLIGGDGKILMTNAEFFSELANPSRDLATVIREKVTGTGKVGDK